MQFPFLNEPAKQYSQKERSSSLDREMMYSQGICKVVAIKEVTISNDFHILYRLML